MDMVDIPEAGGQKGGEVCRGEHSSQTGNEVWK